MQASPWRRVPYRLEAVARTSQWKEQRMIIDQLKQQSWGFSGRSVAAALLRIRLRNDEWRAARARHILQASGYTADLPADGARRQH